MKSWIVFSQLVLMGFAFCGPQMTIAQNVPSEISKAYALLPVNSQFKHRFESADLKEGQLQFQLWYEDSSVTRTGQPSDSLFCRIAHMLIYGRHVDRSTTKEALPIDLAFRKLPQIQGVRINFFAVFYTNKPFPPQWDVKSNTPNQSRLRVVWAREEKIIPYLSYSISRGEWKTLGDLIRSKGQMNYENFESQLCGNVLKVAPQLKANFKEIQLQLQQQRSGVK